MVACYRLNCGYSVAERSFNMGVSSGQRHREVSIDEKRVAVKLWKGLLCEDGAIERPYDVKAWGGLT